MGGDVGLSNHRFLGRHNTKDYDISWYLEADETHPTLMYLTKVTLSQGIISKSKRSYPIDVLNSIHIQLDVLLRYREDAHVCPECGGERGLTNDCPTCNG